VDVRKAAIITKQTPKVAWKTYWASVDSTV